MAPDPPGAPSRPRPNGTTASSAGRQAASSRMNRLARGNAATVLRSRASLESDGMVSNSDDSASFGNIQLPRRQPVFTLSASASTAEGTSQSLYPQPRSQQSPTRREGGGDSQSQHQQQQQQQQHHQRQQQEQQQQQQQQYQQHPQHQQHSVVEQQQRQSSGSTNPVPYETPTAALRNAKLLNLNPGLRPSSRMSTGSNSSFNFESPKPRQLAKLVSEAGPSRSSPPQTPQTPQHLVTGTNPDGSQSVIRNDDDANNSGLLDLSPILTRPGRRSSKANLLATPSSLHFGTPTHSSKRPSRSTLRPLDDAMSQPSQPSPKTASSTAMKVEAATGMINDQALRQADESILDAQYKDRPLGSDAQSAVPHASETLGVPPTLEEIEEVGPEAAAAAAATADANGMIQDEADAEEAEEEPDFNETLNRLRRWRHDAMQQHLYETAIFWGDKILSLETSAAAYNDAYHLAQCYFYTHQYARAEHLLTNPLRTGASRHAAAAVARARAEQNQAKPSNASGALASEAEEEGDALLDALAATRAHSQLPASILARSSTKGSMYSASTCGKRKERGFTTSATGSASSGAESVSEVNGYGNGKYETGSSHRSRRSSSSSSSQGDERSGRGDYEYRGDPDGSIVIRPVERPRSRGGNRRSLRPGQQHPEADEDEDEDGEEGEPDSDSNLAQADADLIEVKDKEAVPPDGPSLVNHSLACRYLAAQCQVRLGKYHEALDLIGDNSQWSGAIGNKRPSNDGGIKLGSTVAYLRGQIHLRLEDLPRARESFMTALALDVKNYEAFSALIDGNLLGVEQQWSFVQGLEYLAQAGDEEGAAEDFEFIRLIYTTRLSKQGKTYALNTAAARRRLASEYGLSNNPDVLLGLAEELFSRLRYADTYTVTSRILELSADHPGALPIHIACIYHLKNLRPALFMLAHRLTELDPESPVSWYAVGTWYATTRRWADARRYFSKASLLDPRFAPSWIAFGHTFAMEGESDQAITAYSTASRLFPQSHLPRLFIGMEHLHQGNLSLARLSLEGSAQIWDEDPLTANERGVVAYQSNDLSTAIGFFQQALRLAEKTQEPASAWKGTHLNLGLAYRRAGADEEARASVLTVTELDPHCYLAKLTLGMIAHKQGDLEDAIGWYHEALSINPRDQHGTDLLDFALDEKVSAGISDFSTSLDPEGRFHPASTAAPSSIVTTSAGTTHSPSKDKGKERHLSPAPTPYRASYGAAPPVHAPVTPQIRFDVHASPSSSLLRSHAAKTPGTANRTRQIGELTTAEMSLDVSSSPFYRHRDPASVATESSADLHPGWPDRSGADSSAMDEESFG